MAFTKKYVVPGLLSAALALMAPTGASALLPPDFVLGPAGRVTIAVDKDSSSGGCLGSDTSECDRYSMKISLTINLSGDISDDLSGANNVGLIIGQGGQLCAHDTAVFGSSFPKSSLTSSKTRRSEFEKFSGPAQGLFGSGAVTVPISFVIKTDLNSGIGTLTAKGLGQGLSTLSGNNVDVLLVVQESVDDGENDGSCVTVPLTLKTSP